MEYVRRQIESYIEAKDWNCLNPYSNGICPKTIMKTKKELLDGMS